ncbi:kinase-like protein [Xylariaceae sp. FL0255]|nr:kinase-like protein [Xylariaceae sp. FL0255]
MSLPFLRGPFGGAVTIIRHAKPKPRPSFRTIERTAAEPLPMASAPDILYASLSNSNSNNTNGNSNTTSSGNNSGPSNSTGTTGKTSFDSNKVSNKDGNPVDKRPATILHHKEPETVTTAVDSSLTTIQETISDPDPPSPTVLTVEKAAAAKIYLETYFNEKLHRASPRSLRRRYLEGELYHNTRLSPAEKNMRRALFYQNETRHLRQTRVLMAQSIGAMKGQHNRLSDHYEVLKILGKGSFGVVRLVREREFNGNGQANRVYAMKVIRKSAMLRTSQEGHLRAERDFLVASEGSQWIVPLIASFQDAANLYLVMEYMPGGDFLGLLIRENILSEPVAKFYIAEMILCIEEAHSLRCIHRDIKPDNFLVSASGHLKISDFGLAFDGHWSHDTSYYHTQRYSLLQKLGLSVEGDASDRAEGLQGKMKWAQGVAQAMQKHERQPAPFKNSDVFPDEPLLNWRNRCGIRSSARSCVGTSQYMAPEVIREGGRQQTKKNIVNHHETFAFPPRPVVSRRCMDLITSLICAKEDRLSTKRYQLREAAARKQAIPAASGSSTSHLRHRDHTGRPVYAYDGEDIKSHKWFRDIPWAQLHMITPPFVPHILSAEDAHYFDEEEPVSDWSDTSSEDPQKMAAMHAQLAAFPRHTRNVLAQFVVSPYDSARLKHMDREIDALVNMSTPAQQRAAQKLLAEQMKLFIRTFGRRERKRPRDRLLRDQNTKGTALEVRKQTAFMGYTFRRAMGLHPVAAAGSGAVSFDGPGDGFMGGTGGQQQWREVEAEQ